MSFDIGSILGGMGGGQGGGQGGGFNPQQYFGGNQQSGDPFGTNDMFNIGGAGGQGQGGGQGGGNMNEMLGAGMNKYGGPSQSEGPAPSPIASTSLSQLMNMAMAGQQRPQRQPLQGFPTSGGNSLSAYMNSLMR